MYSIDLPVPPAFVITTKAYKEFLEHNKISEKIYNELNNLDVENNQELQRRAENCRNLILNSEIPEHIKNDILESYDNMNVNEDLLRASKGALDIIRAGRDLPYVAVRSSATAEDLVATSFAGQQATFLNIKGNKNLLKAVKECWASLFTGRAVYYRVKNNFPHEKVFIAVIVQKQIQSISSGVMFTANPSTNNESEIVIEAGLGLGETVVSGQITPDMYVIDKESLTIKTKTVNEQEFRLILDPNTNQNAQKNLTEDEAKRQKISDYDIIKLAEIGKRIEQHYEKPQDIEFATENSKIYIVQTRAITTLNKAQDKEENTSDMKILLKGLAASPHIGSGKVKIVDGVNDLDKVLNGNVLVTKMTNPDFVPAMRRASAIVTDEGGATCIEGDTKIFTNIGFIKLKEVSNFLESNTNLFTLSLEVNTKKVCWRRVVASTHRKSKTIEIAPYLHPTKKNFDTIKITPDHRMITLWGTSLIEEKLGDLVNNKHNIFVIDSIPKLEINKKQIEMDKLAYLCGAFFSDGHIEKRKSGRPMRVKFTQKIIPEKMDFINQIKSDFLNYFNSELRNYIKEGTIIKGTGTERAASFESSRAYPALILNTVRENIVEIIVSMELVYIEYFLAGLLDGDGHFNREKDYLELCIDRKDSFLLEAIIVGCLRLSILPKVRIKKNTYVVLLTENINQILKKCKRIKGHQVRVEDYKLFDANQLIPSLNINDWRGNLYNYLNKNRSFVGINWLYNYLKEHSNNKILADINSLQNSDLRMYRYKKINEGEYIDVYNITIDADSDIDHNYVIFTKSYIPMLVGNCHAAIVSRELGIACVIGTHTATKILQENQLVTVDGSKGLVYDGQQEIKESEIQEYSTNTELETITKIKVNCDMPESIESALKQNPDGVGLLRLEFIIAEGRTHPAKYIKDNRSAEYTVLIKQGIRDIAKKFFPRPVWVRTSDIRTDEYRDLEGGEEEPKEFNPMLGFHGIRRSLKDIGILKAEIQAIKELYEEGLTNISIMLPFVISPEEVQKTKEILNELNASEIPLGVMVETPAAVWMIEDLCKEGISFISFGTNDLTQTVLAVDRNNENLQEIYNELNPAVLRCISYVIKVCKKYNVETSICGQAGSNPSMAEFLVKTGIDSISANIDAVQKIRLIVSRAERKLMLDAARSRNE